MQAPFWSQGLNRYAYTFNDPVNNTDPSGFQAAGEIGLLIGQDKITYSSGEIGMSIVGPSSTGAAPASAAPAGAGSTGTSAPITGAEAAGSGAALSSVLGMTGSVLNTVRKALEGGYLGQKSTPSSSSQTTSPTGQQAANSTPPRVGTDAASANDPVEVPAQPSNQAFAPKAGNPILSDPAFQITDTSETWEAGLDIATTFVPGPGSAKTAVTVGRGVAKKAGEVLSRLGRSRESAARLARKAAEAEEAIGIHGVSTTAGPPGGPASQAARSSVEQHFPVHNTPTRADPLHRTVELPKPVTEAAADLFNRIFGR
jgi:hypothetical protein